ncbi:MAG: CarD family transcriptional regulator [Beijerinckiaceae bacterium]
MSKTKATKETKSAAKSAPSAAKVAKENTAAVTETKTKSKAKEKTAETKPAAKAGTAQAESSAKVETKKVEAGKAASKKSEAAAPETKAAAKPRLAASGSKVAAAKTQTEAVVAPVVRPRLASGSSGPTLAPAPVAVLAKSKPVNASQSESKPVAKPNAAQSGFKAGDFIVYPAHGVGQILAVEKQEVAGFTLELFVINFLQDKMTLKVPLPKVLEGAIRKLSDPARVGKALDTLTGRARIKRTMWSRRAQEYEAKINSGDLVTIAEVVRDLYRSDSQPEQSYSERQLYEAALDRMAREIAAVRKLEANESLKLIEEHLKRGPRRGAKSEAAAEDAEAKEGDSAENMGEAA